MKEPECIHHNYFDLFFEVVYVELSVNYLGLFTEVQTDLHFYKETTALTAELLILVF